MASNISGLVLVITYSRAFITALYTARISFPSTRIVAIPYPGPRLTMPSPRYCSLAGVDIA